MFCEKCGKQIPDGSVFCDGCGAPVAAPATPANTADPAAGGAAVQTPAAPKQPLNRKTLIGIVAAVAVVVVVILLIALIAGGSDTPLLYVTDGELVHNTNIKKNETVVIDDEYISSDMRYSYYSDAAAAQSLASYAAFTEDGKKFVFLADYDDSDNAYTLFWIATKDLDSEKAGDAVVKVASGVNSFKLADDASVMLYTKDSKLYYYNFKDDAQLVTKDLSGSLFKITADGKSIAYIKDDDESVLYVYSVKEDETTKIDSDVYRIYSWDIDNGFQNMLYSKYDDDEATEALYRGGSGNEKTKLFSKAYTILGASNEGYAFYVESDEDWVLTLYAYDMDAGEKIKIAEDYGYIAYVSSKNGVVVYCEYDEDYEETWYLSVKGAEGDELDERVATGAMAEDGKTLYLIEGEDDEYELVSYTIGKDGASDRTKLTEDVYNGFLRIINGTLCYMVDFDDSDYTGTLYAWDGKEVKLADEVYCYAVSAYGEDSIAFFADPDDDHGTMYLFDGKDTTKVASDVYMYNWTEFDGDLLYLADFDEDDGGTLYQFDGKNKTKIASDVQAIISVG